MLASAPGGRFVTRALERLVELPPGVQARPNGIGPHLMQEIAPELTPPALVVHPPPVFYPLGPEISRHWFNVRGRGAAGPGAVARDARRALVRVGAHPLLTSRIDPDYVRAHAGRQLFSELALPFAR